MFRIIIITIVFTIAANFNLNSQDIKYLRSLKDSIDHYSAMVIFPENKEHQSESNSDLSYFVRKALQQEKSIDYRGFDSLKNISVLTSDDKKLRVVSWTMPLIEGGYKYFGYVQSYDKKNKRLRIFELEDKTDNITYAERKTLRKEKWYGAHYYKIITTKKSRKKIIYTLLGWKGFNEFSNKKVIELITLRSDGEPVFGYPLFKINDMKHRVNSRPRRIVFTYSKRAPMILDYGKHHIVKVKKKKQIKIIKDIKKGFSAQEDLKDEKVKKKRIEANMITFDRLISLNEETEGINEFLIPEVNIIDAFVFEKGKWVYYEDVDARNKVKQSTKPKKPVEYDLEE